VEEQREQAEHLLLLDTGDALIDEGSSDSSTMGEDVVAGMNVMAYDAMAIGPLELGLGAEELRQRVDEAAFPMLSANVLWSVDRTYLGEPYTVLEVGPYRVGVIGLTRDPGVELGDYLFLEPDDVLAELVPQVDAQVDTVVLLTNVAYRSAIELADAVSGIDLVIAALPRQLPDRAVRTTQTGSWVVTAEQPFPGHSGRRVGTLTVVVQSDGTLRVEAWESIGLGPEIADDAAMRDLLQVYGE
jgi:2',3'-cyclic-nucleotide 2'-phosphodiesterase (5'-nucleotidase family)